MEHSTTASTAKRHPIQLVIIALAVIAGLVIIIGTLWVSAINGTSASASLPAKTPSPTASATPTPSASPSASAKSCPARFVQEEVSRADNRLDRDFQAKFEAATANSTNVPKSERDFFIRVAGTDVYKLVGMTHVLGLSDDSQVAAQADLVRDNCLSSEGQDLWNQFKGALTDKRTTFEDVEAPADYFNSGVHGGVYGVSETQGIGGNRKAVKITLANGNFGYIMIRCGNPVYPGQPDIPKVPTDNPPAPPAQTPVCPYNPALPPNSPECVKPKSGKTTDYRQPGDTGKGADVGTGTKPAVPATPAPAQPTPAPVQTSRPGGGGVVDTPSKPGGSETGGTAPGATPPPPPAPSPTPTPPNEGGNSGGGTGGDTTVVEPTTW